MTTTIMNITMGRQRDDDRNNDVQDNASNCEYKNGKK